MSLVSLVFSSDQETARRLNQVLIELDFDVEHCPEIFGAIEKLTTRRFDVIACDWGEGLEANFLLRTSHELKLNQSAFTVAIANLDSAATARKAGADLVLNKPLIPDQAKRALLSCEKFLTHMRTWLPKLGFTAPAGSTIISRPAETEKMLAEWPRAHTPEPSSTHRSSDILPVVPAFAFENSFSRNDGASFGRHTAQTEHRSIQSRHRKHHGRFLQMAAVATVFLSVGYVFSEPLRSESRGVAKICGQAFQRTAVWLHGTETADLPPKPAPNDNDSFFIPPAVRSRFRIHASPVVRPTAKPATADAKTDHAPEAVQKADTAITASVEIPDSLKRIGPGLHNVMTHSGPSFLASLEPVSLSEELAQKLLLQKIQPSYPEQAIRAGLQGSVILQACIGRDGSIRDLKLVRGSLFLGRAAYNAVKQWRYQPYILNGRPVEAQTYVTVDFRLP